MPIVAVSATITTATRTVVFHAFVGWRRTLIALAAAILLCIVSADGYTRLSNRRALVVRLPLRVHTAVLHVVVVFGGAATLYGAWVR